MDFVTAKTLEPLPQCLHRFYTMEGAGGCGDSYEEYFGNLFDGIKKAKKDLAAEKLMFLSETNVTGIITYARKSDPENANLNGKAMITTDRHIALAVLTDDTIPLLLADKQKPMIAATKLALRVDYKDESFSFLEPLITQMQQGGAQNIIAALGPSLNRQGLDARTLEYVKHLPETGKFITASEKFEWKAYISHRLQKLGVATENIAFDTYEDARFFSATRAAERYQAYGGDRQTGFQFSVIMLR